VWQRDDTALHIAGVGVDQMRATQLDIGIVNGEAVLVENVRRQRIAWPWLEPALIRVMYKRRVGDILAPEHPGIEMVVVQALDILNQCRRQRAYFGQALASGKALLRVRSSHTQRAAIQHQIGTRSEF